LIQIRNNGQYSYSEMKKWIKKHDPNWWPYIRNLYWKIKLKRLVLNFIGKK
jgi:hypothetical protein